MKCGRILEAAANPDRAEDKDDADAGFLGRLFSGLFGKKGAEPEEVRVPVEPDAFPQDPGTTGGSLGDPEGLPDAIETSQGRMKERTPPRKEDTIRATSGSPSNNTMRLETLKLPT